MNLLGYTGRKTALAVAILLLSGCYNVVPLVGEPDPSAEVILELTEGGGARLGGLLGPSVVSARGRPVRWASDSITLSVIATTTARGDEQFWQGERVVIPRDAVSRVRERRIDRGKSALIGVAAVGLAVVGAQAISGKAKGIGKPPPTGKGL